VVSSCVLRGSSDDRSRIRTDCLRYQNQLKVDEYYWFDPFHPDDWAGFELRHGLYAPMRPNDRGWLISQRLGLSLTRWRGVYEDTEATWLRWMTLDGEILPTSQAAVSGCFRKAGDQARRRMKPSPASIFRQRPNGAAAELRRRLPAYRSSRSS
jgi:hypothetical protein